MTAQTQPAGADSAFAPYMLGVAACGVLSLTWAATRLPGPDAIVPYLLLVILSLGSSRFLSVRLEHTRAQISLVEVFVFLALLLYGGGGAVLLAATEALVASVRITRRPLQQLFNAGAVACSTTAAVVVVESLFGSMVALTQQPLGARLLAAMLVVGLTQYLFNSGIVGFAAALRGGQPFWPTWRRHYQWAAPSYLAASSSALLIAKLILSVGLFGLLATVPIIIVIYLSHATYARSMETTQAQVIQATRHMEEMRASEERFRSVFDDAAIGMAVVASDGRWLRVNRALCGLLGYSAQELVKAPIRDWLHPSDSGSVQSEMSRIARREIASLQRETRFLGEDGRECWTLLSISRLAAGDDADNVQLAFQIQDISDRKRFEKQLLHDAFHDTLTGLPNRALFIDHLRLSLGRRGRNPGRTFAVLFLDLDGFKRVNDSLGHSVGDHLLRVTATRLAACLQPGDTVARLGGDEFTVLLEDLDNIRQAIEKADWIRNSLNHPISLEGHEVVTTVSIGITVADPGYARPEEMLRDADTAMYRAKALGGDSGVVFDSGMHVRAMNRLQREADLRRAIDRDELMLFYQPIVGLADGVLSGFEALARWQHPEHGLIPPDEFIPLAEESGLILQLGLNLLRQACTQSRQWCDRFPNLPRTRMSVNLSARQFRQQDLATHVHEVLVETGCDPMLLKLEITESAVMDDVDSTVITLRGLRALGIEASIDDFGTGYSSLSYLHRFPASTLKIDRSFVTRMADGDENVEIVRTIVSLARGLRMQVIAEGIETESQLATLRALGCQEGQGYLFSRPVSAEEAGRILGSGARFEVGQNASALVH